MPIRRRHRNDEDRTLVVAHFDQFAQRLRRKPRKRASSASFSGVWPPTSRWTFTSRPVLTCFARKLRGPSPASGSISSYLLIEVHGSPRSSSHGTSAATVETPLGPPMLQYSHGPMKLLSRVVWSEGMYLGPHHFQVQSRYFEDSIQFATLFPLVRRVRAGRIELDADALHNGTVALLHARGIFPDGLIFNMPESDALPAHAPWPIFFRPRATASSSSLAIPPRKPTASTARSNPTPRVDSRFVAESRVLHDENTGADERQVTPRPQESPPAVRHRTHRRPARLADRARGRDGSGHFAYDCEFCAPRLCRSAPACGSCCMVQRLIEILDEKSATIGRAMPRGPRRILHARDRQFLAAPRCQFRTCSVASSADRQARPSRRTLTRTFAPGRRAVYLCARFASARAAALRSRRT